MSDQTPPTRPVGGPSEPGPPERFADDGHRYRLDSRIATGGMGEVWRATDTALGREVAVKLLKAEYADDAMFRHRFEVEARHAAALHHPGVAGVFDFGEGAARGDADGSGVPHPFLVMELVEGEPLSALLREGQDNRLDLDRDVVRDLLAQAGEAIGAAHAAGIVHRDIKPANLMVTPQRRVKITDFGIARAADGVGITQTGAVMGTPQYLSPEQARGEVATSRSDVYSLGVVAFECLAGRRPFEADSPVATALAHLRDPIPDLPDDVPADLAAVVRRALAKDPEERFADGAAFAVALRDPATAVMNAPGVPPVVPGAAEGDDATRMMPATPAAPMAAVPPVAAASLEEPVTPPGSHRVTEPGRRSPWPAVLITLLVVAAVVIVLLLVTGGDDDGDPTDEPTTSPTRSRTTDQTPTEQTSEPETETVEVDEGDYVGRPVDEVASELEGLGLQVSRDEIDNPGGEQEGLVDGVNPSGTLAVGDGVTVSFWGPEPETQEPEPEPSEPSETPTSETPTPTDVPTTPSTSATQPSPTGSASPRAAAAASPSARPSPGATTTPGATG